MTPEQIDQLVEDILETGYVRIYWLHRDTEVSPVNDRIINLIVGHSSRLYNMFSPASKKEFEKQQLEDALK